MDTQAGKFKAAAGHYWQEESDEPLPVEREIPSDESGVKINYATNKSGSLVVQSAPQPELLVESQSVHPASL